MRGVLFLVGRLWLRLRNHLDNFARHLVDQKNLVFHFRIPVVGKFRDLLSQLRRKPIRFNARWQCGADFWREIFRRLGRFEFEPNLGVLGQQGLTNLLTLRGNSDAAPASMGSAARRCRRSVRPRPAYYRRRAPGRLSPAARLGIEEDFAINTWWAPTLRYPSLPPG